MSPADALRGLHELALLDEVPDSELERAMSWVRAAARSGDPAFRDLLARVVRRTDPGTVSSPGSPSLLLNLLCLDALYRIDGSESILRGWLEAFRESPYVAGNAFYVLGRSPDPAILQRAQEVNHELGVEGMQVGMSREEHAWRNWVQRNTALVQIAAHFETQYAETRELRARIGLLLVRGFLGPYASERDRLAPTKVRARDLLDGLSRQEGLTFVAEYLAIGIDDLRPFLPGFEVVSERTTAIYLHGLKVDSLPGVSPAARGELEPALRALDPQRRQ